MAKTNKSDVIDNFVRYHGRQPRSSQDLKTINYLTTKSPQEVERLLAKNSPVTKGLIWADYLKQQEDKTAPKETEPARTTPKETEQARYNPFEEAAKYGYTKEDFANDPGFYNYWKNKTPEELKAQLEKRGDFDIRTGKKQLTEEEKADEGLTNEQKALMDELNQWIDNTDYSIEQKAILKEIAAGDYTSGQKIPTVEEIGNIIEQAAMNAETDLSPYYEKVTGREIADLKRKMENIRTEAARYSEREAMDYNQKLQQAKQNLRSRGLTFSGVSRKQLGSQGALQAKGVEGQLPTARRMRWKEKEADYLQRAGKAGLEAERELGTERVRDLDLGRITTPYSTSDLYRSRGGVGDYPYETGDIPLERKREKEKSKWDRVSKYRSYI